MHDEIDEQLRLGLLAQPSPNISDGFDAAVIAAVRRPTPWWQSAWDSLRPALTGGVCSLGVTLALVAAVGHLPSSLPAPTESPVIAAQPAQSVKAQELAADLTDADLDALLQGRTHHVYLPSPDSAPPARPPVAVPSHSTSVRRRASLPALPVA